MLQLDAKDRRLDGVQPAVDPKLQVMVLWVRSVDAEHANMLCQSVIIGSHHAPVPVAAEILCGEEAETPDVPHGT